MSPSRASPSMAGSIRLGGMLWLTVALFFSSPTHVSAITCLEAARAAVDATPISQTGLGWPCCSRTRASCILDGNECDAAHPDFASCFSVDGTVACQITETNSTGAPCAIYDGEAGPAGVTAVSDNSLNFSGLESAVRANWPALGLNQEHVMCCSSSSGDCHLGELVDDDINPCNKGEYELKCAGNEELGVCSAFANTTATHELGIFYRINFSASSSSSSGTSTLPSSASTTPQSSSTALGQDATGLPAASESKKKGTNAIVIALPVVLGLLIIFLLAFFLLRRRRQRAGKEMEAVPYSASMRPLSSGVSNDNSYRAVQAPSERFAEESHYTSAPPQSVIASTETPFATPSFSIQSPPPSGKAALAASRSNPARATSPAPPYSAE
ncbi:hypothetical protein BKA62DRAFT_300358 [Auriculariales sp. MPI-PUGE-AT-0066]|nr:hypothetical protein BKA62DRAFT_300358 [Auriculariales sp. MPI-PUGE-AT-0066]